MHWGPAPGADPAFLQRWSLGYASFPGGRGQALLHPLLFHGSIQRCQLPLVMQLHCVLYRVYGVAEIAVALSSTRVNDDGTVGGDEPGLLQFQHVLAHGVVAGADGLSDGLVAGRAPIGFPVLPVEQESVDGNSGASQVQVEDFIRQREKFFIGADRDHVRCDSDIRSGEDSWHSLHRSVHHASSCPV